MGRMAWGATTPRVCLGSVAIGKRLWRSRAVEKSQSRLSHRAWKSRPKRGIPTSPQPRRRRVINRQPDNSLATKTGPFNLLRTGWGVSVAGQFPISAVGTSRLGDGHCERSVDRLPVQFLSYVWRDPYYLRSQSLNYIE